MDEIFGYFPPVGEPPSKKPLLTLLKQARAFGVGVRAGDAEPGRPRLQGPLQRRHLVHRPAADRARQAARARRARGRLGPGRARSRRSSRSCISALGKPRLPAEQRARGRARGLPDALDDVVPARPAHAAADRRADGAASRRRMPAPAARAGRRPRRSAAAPARGRAARRGSPRRVRRGHAARRRPSGVAPAYLPLRGAAPAGASLAYRPDADRRRARAPARYQEPGRRGDRERPPRRVRRRPDRRRLGRPRPIWPSRLADLESTPREGAAFHELPAAARDAKGYARWSKDYADWLYQTQTVTLLRSPSQKLVSHSGESEADFRARLAQGAREGRDSKAEALRAKYDAKVAALQQKLHTAQQAVDREENQERGAGLQTAVSVAGSILGGFLGRKSRLGRVDHDGRPRCGPRRPAARRRQACRGERHAPAGASWPSSEASFAQDAAGMGADGAATEQLDSVLIRPKKADIDVTLVTLAFAPHWQDAGGQLTPRVLDGLDLDAVVVERRRVAQRRQALRRRRLRAAAAGVVAVPPAHRRHRARRRGRRRRRPRGT